MWANMEMWAFPARVAEFFVMMFKSPESQLWRN
jgi:hypothetical protein